MFADAIDAPEAVRLVTVAVVNSATPALTEATEALVAVRFVTVPLVITAVPRLAEAIDAPVAVRLVTVPLVISATPAVMLATDTMPAVTLPVTFCTVIARVPSSDLMLVTSRFVRSSVVAVNVPITATARLAEAADKLVA